MDDLRVRKNREDIAVKYYYFCYFSISSSFHSSDNCEEVLQVLSKVDSRSMHSFFPWTLGVVKVPRVWLLDLYSLATTTHDNLSLSPLSLPLPLPLP